MVLLKEKDEVEYGEGGQAEGKERKIEPDWEPKETKNGRFPENNQKR